MNFRFANEADCGLILSFIRQLADYENMSDQVVATEDLLREWIFVKKKAEVLFVCEDGKEVGFALFFHNFSTFLGRAGIYLEDLFVLPESRGKGYGKIVAYAMVKEILRREKLPVWDCDTRNEASMRLACSVGFEIIGTHPWYKYEG